MAMGVRTWLEPTPSIGLVWFPAPDSYAATNAATAGANVLSESYLYTSEAVSDSLEHLAPGGIVAAQFGEFDYDDETEPHHALRRPPLGTRSTKLGIHDPARHILVATSDAARLRQVVDDSREADPVHTDAKSAASRPASRTVPGSELRYAPGHPELHNTVATVATSSSSELADFYENYPYARRSHHRQSAILLALRTASVT